MQAAKYLNLIRTVKQTLKRYLTSTLRIDAPANDTEINDRIEKYSQENGEWIPVQTGWAGVKQGDLVRIYLAHDKGYIHDPQGFSVFMVLKNQMEQDNEYVAVIQPFAPVSTMVH